VLSAAEHIGSVIDAAENQEFRFDHFMNEALYGPAGFYTSGVGLQVVAVISSPHRR